MRVRTFLLGLATVLLASLFTICAMFAVLGTLSAVLPRETFRACSSWVRGLLLVALLALLASGFAGPALIGGIERFPDSPLRFLPSLWYTGLYQSMQHRASPALAGLARWGLDATLAAAVWMMIAYALSYRRRFAGVLEGGRRPSQQTMIRVLLALLDRFAPRRPGFGRACHRFAVRALLRNEAHRLVLAVAIGLGWLIAFQDISCAPPDGAGKVPALALLQAPLAVAYLLVLGLRLAFELPCGVAANWVFRAVLNPRENETIGVARRLVLGFLTLVVLAPALAFYWWRWGPAVSALQTLYVLGLSVLLAEFQFAGYRKVPLTCPMPGFRDNLLMLCLIQFLGYQAFTRVGAALEQWMFADPWRFLLLPAAMAWAWRWNLRRLQNAREAGELEEGVTFENAPIRAVERLNLSGGA